MTKLSSVHPVIKFFCNEPNEDLTDIKNCNHEEADSRIFIHLLDSIKKGLRKATIRTVDTDIVFLALKAVLDMDLDELWIHFGVGKGTRYIPIHEISVTLGPSKCKVLPLFHTLTGSDQTSGFAGRSKKTAWAVWNTMPELTDGLLIINECPSKEEVDSVLPVIERFVVLIYHRGSSSVSVNEARKELFKKKGRPIESIPPTADALMLHVKRAVFQGAFVWGQVLTPFQILPSPSNLGWQKIDNIWKPLWTLNPIASKVCQELIKCGCNPENSCKQRCKCAKSNLPCTSLCKCGGDCEREL